MHFFVVSFFGGSALFILLAGSVALLVTRPWEGVVCVWRLHLFIIMAVAICAIALLFHKQALLACLVCLLPGAGDGGSALEPTPLIETNGGLPLLGRCGGL
jgi:hypothetical protein